MPELGSFEIHFCQFMSKKWRKSKESEKSRNCFYDVQLQGIMITKRGNSIKYYKKKLYMKSLYKFDK